MFKNFVFFISGTFKRSLIICLQKRKYENWQVKKWLLHGSGIKYIIVLVFSTLSIYNTYNWEYYLLNYDYLLIVGTILMVTRWLMDWSCTRRYIMLRVIRNPITTRYLKSRLHLECPRYSLIHLLTISLKEEMILVLLVMKFIVHSHPLWQCTKIISRVFISTYFSIHFCSFCGPATGKLWYRWWWTIKLCGIFWFIRRSQR